MLVQSSPFIVFSWLQINRIFPFPTVENAGGKALPCIVDVRDEGSVSEAVDGAIKQFGGIDVVVNNASAISLTGTQETPMKRYDLMHQINTRGTYLVWVFFLQLAYF